MNKIIDVKQIQANIAASANYDVFNEKRLSMIANVRAVEEDALNRAVCRYFSITDAFEAVRRVTCRVDTKGNRRFESVETGEIIIQFYSLRFRMEDDCKMVASMDYRTFDGIK